MDYLPNIDWPDLPDFQRPIFISYDTRDFRVALAIFQRIANDQDKYTDIFFDWPLPHLIPCDFKDVPDIRMFRPVLPSGVVSAPDCSKPRIHERFPAWMSYIRLPINEAKTMLVIATPNSKDSDGVASEVFWFTKGAQSANRKLAVACINGSSPPASVSQFDNVQCFDVSCDVNSVIANIDKERRRAEAAGRWEDARLLILDSIRLYLLKNISVSDMVIALRRRARAEVQLGQHKLAADTLNMSIQLVDGSPVLRATILSQLADALTRWLILESQTRTALLLSAKECWREALALLMAHRDQARGWQGLDYEGLSESCRRGIKAINDDLHGSGFLQRVKGLIQRSHGLFKRSKGLTALQTLVSALRDGDLEHVDSQLALVQDPDSDDGYGNPILSLAAHGGHHKVVHALLSRGANVENPNRHGLTPLHFAVDNGSLEVADVLLHHGANVDCRSSSGLTALLIAAQSNREQVARLLLAKGADVNAREDREGLTPLIIAAQYGWLVLAEELIDNGAQIDAEDFFGWTPLMKAVGSGHSELVKMLVQKGADVNLMTKKGGFALYVAAQCRQIEISRVLLDASADPNMSRPDGLTPLMVAAVKGCRDVVELLIRNGADVDRKTLKNQTATEFTNDAEILNLLKSCPP